MINKNRLEITGNLVADPELRHTPTGKAVVKARIIHTDSHKNRETGEWVKSEPMGIDIEVWNAYGESFAKTVRKGTAVLLEGSLKPNTFKGKDGTSYFGLRLRVDQWQVVAHPRDKGDQPAQEIAGEPETPAKANRSARRSKA